MHTSAARNSSKTSVGSWCRTISRIGWYVALPKPALMRAASSTASVCSALYAASLAARRRGDLDEGEAADPFRMQLQQRVDGAQPLDDALGVVEPLDADAEQHVVAQGRALAHRGAALRRRGF